MAGPPAGLGVSKPRAAGVRRPYAAVPERVRAWVEETLGSPVASTAEQVGGMSPGCATRLVCADGTRAFVKAVGPELNAMTPELFRHEIAVLGVVGEHPLWAPLLASYDEPGGWVALLLGDVEGRHPDMNDAGDVATVLAAVDRFVDTLAGRGVGHAETLGTLDRSIGRYESMWPHLGDVPDDLLPGWARERVEEMRARVPELIARSTGDHVVNYDIRNDNLLLRPDGDVVFVDWGMARVGAAWLDPFVARLEWADQPVFDDLVVGSPALRDLGDSAVTTFLYLLGTWLAYRTATDHSGPAGLAEFRVVESRRFLEAARRRLG